jgi:hypothetical protein
MVPPGRLAGSGGLAGAGGRAGTGGPAGAGGQGGRTDGGAPDRLPTTDGAGGASARDAANDAPDAESRPDAAAPCAVAIDGGTMACTTSIVSGNDNDFFCGLKTDGRINCWGSDPDGTFFVGPYGVLPPAIAKAPGHLAQLAVTNSASPSNGEAFCGVDSSGQGTCWDGNTTKDMGGGLKAIVLSDYGTCTLDLQGSVACSLGFVPMRFSGGPYTKILASEDNVATLDEAGVPSYLNDVFPAGRATSISRPTTTIGSARCARTAPPSRLRSTTTRS